MSLITPLQAPGLAALIATAALSPVGADEVVRTVSADLRQANGPLNTLFKRCVGAGRANEGLRAGWQRQLTLARRDGAEGS